MNDNEDIPIINDLVLIGGGHSHLSVIMELSKKPLKGNRITLISNEIDTPYSGMIPGFIEGIYSWRESHIDLYKLCLKLSVRFIHSEVTKISAINKEVFLKGLAPDGGLFVPENLKKFDSIFAAAGHPNAVFEIDFENLKALTLGETKEITE